LAVPATVEGAGVELAYEVRGEGPAVVLVHGMAADAQVWEPVVEALAGRARTIAYDRRGYGESGAPEPYERTTVEEQAEDAAALIDALGAAPAVVCGADLGALVCLDLVKRHRDLLAGAVLFEPPLFAFVPAATEALAAQRAALETALRDSGPAAAVDVWLAGEPVDEERRERARRAARPFFADYAAFAGWPVTRGELRAIDLPMRVVTRPGAPRHVKDAAEALAPLVPDVRLSEDGDVADALAGLLPL
jgi:pimeloyl-ACP methyl ester carboxylesterase